jgi:ribonuclease HI
MPSLFAEPTSNLPWINAHCDGGARGNPGPAGYGAVIKDDAGHMLAELSEFLGFKTNNFAEYSGLLGCLQWALDNGHKQMRVVSDSELMVKQIQGKYKVNSPDLRPLWEEARRRIARLDGFQISHALRHKNKDADRLANDAMDRGTGDGLRREPSAGERGPARPTPPTAPKPVSSEPKMVRGFTRDGTVHLLGGAKLPDGVFVKVIVE